MIKRLLGRLLDGLIGLFAREVSAQDIRAYVEKHYQRLIVKGNLDKNSARDLETLKKAMKTLGWLGNNQKENKTDLRLDIDVSEADTSFPAVDWFGTKGLMPGAGRILDSLNTTTRSREVAAMMEKILRHVEVRREKSLRKFTSKITNEQEWLERLDIGILFSRAARRHHDLRFLNTALKMNGWYFNEINPDHSDIVTIRFMLSLAEGEVSAQELLA